MKKIVGILVIILVVVGGIYFFKNKPTSTKGSGLKVGVILPLTGDLSITGEKLYQGVQLAQAQLEKEGVKFVVEDSHSKPTDAVSAASKLLNVDKVDVIIGTYSPDETIAVAPLALKENKDVFSFSFCSDSFKPLTNVFCGYPNADKQLDTVVPMIQKKGIKTMALVDANSDFGINSRDAMVRKAPSAGYTVVYNELVPNANGDYRTFATKIIASKADSVFVTMDNPVDALTVVKQLRELGFKGTAITFVDVDNKNLEKFGSFGEGTFAPGIAPSQFSSDYTSMYKAKFSGTPDYVSALGYDMTTYVVKAMEENPGKGSKTAVFNYKYKNPAIENFSFLEDRTVVYQLELQMAKNQQYVKAEY
ncbi:MAG: urea transport system substrate-binding protein [Patescibacteria group bacterium]|nr:urea transport system substrate-binding protein [Patescibacteria group bacterium]MDQ5968852.1 urea transport system substrate-binding protein [Patescibacteria group bacterium]MDQ5971700.1 urea transport system substrate-binding protein [Patescibacteria group bacterium]